MFNVYFCTNKIEDITHGPAKFASYLRGADFECIKLTILSPDFNHSSNSFIKVNLRLSNTFRAIGMLFNGIDYYFHLRKSVPDDENTILLFNHGMNAYFSTFFFRKAKIIAMINDSNSLDLSLVKMRWNKYQIRYFVFKFFEKIAARRSDIVIANSFKIKSRIEEEYLVSPGKIKVLYKSVDFKEIPSEWNKRKINKLSAIKLLFVKSDPVVGGLKFLLEAINQISTYNFDLKIVGPDKKSKEIFSDYLNKSDHSIEFVGKQTQKEVYRLMECSDILISPSLKEGLGVVNIEALGWGLPVVSSKVGGIPEVLGEGKYGWLSMPQSSNSLKENIINCIENDDLRELKSREGFTFVRGKFRIESMIKNFEEILIK